MGSKQAPAVDRFAEKVALTDDGCLLWIASINNGGYGTFAVGGGRSTVAHRWSYEHHVGQVPEGMFLDHLCRTRNCVMPAHLEPVTPQENLLRGVGVGQANAAKTHCSSGHEFTPENTYIRAGTTHRQCRTCTQQRGIARREAKNLQQRESRAARRKAA